LPKQCTDHGLGVKSFLTPAPSSSDADMQTCGKEPHYR
jgi:hypothetical protein